METAFEAPLDLPEMSVEEYLAWASHQEGRFELFRGKVYPMAAERSRHGLCKGNLFFALRTAVLASGRNDLFVYTDGMAVQTPDGVFEPDVQLRCGTPLNGDATVVTDPILVAEIGSPSTRKIDTGLKFRGYFRIPALQHYLIIDPVGAPVIHHRREADGAIKTSLISCSHLMLDPPGLELDLRTIFD